METVIIELERAAAMHWRGTEEARLGDWLLRAADGFTGRANSVLPLGDPGPPLDDALAIVTGWYRDRGLPPMISVPTPLDGTSELDDQLAKRSWPARPGPAFVMTAATSAVPARADVEVHVADEPDVAWLRAHRYRGQSDLPPVRRQVLTSAAAQAFVSIRAEGTAVAVGRLSMAAGWAGLSAVEVDAAHRRRGLGGAITSACCQTAAARGYDKVFLQVETDNQAARALYERCGFEYAHRYHYRLAPPEARRPADEAGDRRYPG
ncbi:MAG TPA: GNAT family N-acetyltransferase [Trebonia sp.]|nr:GNAT family N-acetyltransferase [Trebonia sp.]